MEFKGTKGKWAIGNYNTTVVSDGEIHVNESNATKSSKKYYGGILICESILDKHDALLMSKAPEMLEMLNKISLALELFNPPTKEISLEWSKEINKLIKEATEI